MEKANLEDINAQLSRELFSLRQKYDVASKELQAAKAELGQIRQAAASTKEDAKAREAEKALLDRMCAEMKAESAALKDENHHLSQELSLSKGRVKQLKESFETSRSSLAHLSETYASRIFVQTRRYHWIVDTRRSVPLCANWVRSTMFSNIIYG